MKDIKIRFVEVGSDTPNPWFYAQKKSLFGWNDIGKTIDMGYGSVWEIYQDKTKDKLLDKLLNEHYKVAKKFCKITEYPQLKIR